MKKHFGVKLSGVVYFQNKTMSPDELDKFLDDFLKFIEKRKMWYGGGVDLIDLNKCYD